MCVAGGGGGGGGSSGPVYGVCVARSYLSFCKIIVV